MLMCCSETAEHHLQGLCLDLKNLRLSPRLLARLAHQVAGKQELHRVTKQLLPDLCQVCRVLLCNTQSPLHASELMKHLRSPVWPCTAAGVGHQELSALVCFHSLHMVLYHTSS